MLNEKHYRGIFALDLGTTKFCLARLKANPAGQGMMVETVNVPADGMRRGMISDKEQAKASLNQLIEIAEKQFQTDVRNVVVGVAGSHLKSSFVNVSTQIINGIISFKELSTLVSLAEASVNSETREILHVIPVGYRIDDRPVMNDPVGFNGRILYAEFFVIDSDKFYLKDIVETCNQAGLQVRRLYSEPFASASVTIPDEYKQLGVAVADIGGGTTDGLVFRNGKPAGVFTINVAGKLMTNDLSIGLNVSQIEAENIKIRFGIKPRPQDSMVVSDIKGQDKTVSGDAVNPILVPRVYELCALIAQDLKPYKGVLGGGLVLTGGGADIRGITEFCQSKLKIPVTRAKPVFEYGKSPDKDSVFEHSPHAPRFATALGLLNLEIGHVMDNQRHQKTGRTSRYLGQFINWLKDLS